MYYRWVNIKKIFWLVKSFWRFEIDPDRLKILKTFDLIWILLFNETNNKNAICSFSSRYPNISLSFQWLNMMNPEIYLILDIKPDEIQLFPKLICVFSGAKTIFIFFFHFILQFDNVLIVTKKYIFDIYKWELFHVLFLHSLSQQQQK